MFTLLNRPGVDYRILDHAPEGRTGPASELRGHPVTQAAKSIVVRARYPDGPDRLALVVVPGDRRVDVDAVRAELGAAKVAFADRHSAERATGCVSGSVLPFSFSEGLPLLADPALLQVDEIFFNAARLDRSVALASADWLTLAAPRIVPVAQPTNPENSPENKEVVSR